VKLVKDDKVVEAEEVDQEEMKKSENETSLNVVRLGQVLEEVGSTNLFKFFINPHDFAESVENLFHLSFLVRQGKCAVEWEGIEPIVCMCFALC
jgi:non-structural maintenance of chromosomes element 4